MCGVGLVARLDGCACHETIARALTVLANMEHRGAAGADADTGDGAGILLQLPDAFLRASVPFALPEHGRYGVGVCFLPQLAQRRSELEQLLEETVAAEGQTVLGWRDVPVRRDQAGRQAQLFAPVIRQLFVGAGDHVDDALALERKLYVIRRLAERAAGAELVIPSFSARTLVYKGMLSAPQLARYFPDLADERLASALALVHSRFSTNTFPSWELAHPYRLIAHNGEINTLRGNVNWIRARESQLASELFGEDVHKVLPVIRPGGSDTAMFDNVLELLTLAGRSLPHALMMMVPEAYAGRPDVSDDLRGFYRFHECLTEAWDGPAAIAFTDGSVIGATLDRNGLRPGRWLETADGWVILASETGVLDVPASQVVRKGRLQPGRLFLVDLAQGRIVPDGEVKAEVAARRPYGAWFDAEHVRLDDLPPARAASARAAASPPAAAVRLHAGGHEGDAGAARGERRRGGRLDGERHAARRALGSPAAPLLLLQAALRAGDESADRPDPRGGRDEQAIARRVGAESARRDAGACAAARDRQPDPARRGARAASCCRLGRLPRTHDRLHVARGRRRRRHRRGACAHLHGGRRRARRGCQRARALRPRSRPGARADAVAARGLGDSPPSRARRHAPPGGARRRVG